MVGNHAERGEDEGRNSPQLLSGDRHLQLRKQLCDRLYEAGAQKTAAAKGRIDKFNKKFGIQ